MQGKSRLVVANQKAAEAIGIKIIKVMIDGKPVSHRQVSCSRCDATINIPATPGVMPEKLRIQFERHGWRVGTKGCLCADCAKSRRPTLTQVVAGEIHDVEYEGEIMSSNPPSANVVVALPAPAKDAQRSPSPSDKTRIRQYLDGHFDDSNGCYLDGGSDQAGGQELGVPWAWVQDLREVAYGPLRENPALVALRQDVTAVAADIAALSKKITVLGEEAASLMGRVTVMSAALKKI